MMVCTPLLEVLQVLSSATLANYSWARSALQVHFELIVAQV